MDIELSDFGKRFAGKIGIAELMDDLGSALAADPAPLMLGGGNPAHVPEVQALARKRMVEILDHLNGVKRGDVGGQLDHCSLAGNIVGQPENCSFSCCAWWG